MAWRTKAGGTAPVEHASRESAEAYLDRFVSGTGVEIPIMVVVTRPHSPRRMANLLRAVQASDPFTPNTARALITSGKMTAFGGLGTWILSQVAQAVLSGTMLTSPGTFKPHQGAARWLAVGLIFAALGQILDRGVAMRAELDTVI